MMDFFTHYFASRWLRHTWHWLSAVAICLFAFPAVGQSLAEWSQIQVERADEDVLLSAQIGFELPSAVEEALLKGIPMYFVAQADITKERWYWSDKKVASAERHVRIAYQALTRRWRVNVTNGGDKLGSTGLILNQSFDTLSQALAVSKRLFRWRVAAASDVEGSGKFRLELRFRLDLSQLPRPFQIGAIGQSDWDVGGTVATPLVLETLK